MIFICLTKFRKKPTKEGGVGVADKAVSSLQKQGVKPVASYWTLGTYDSVYIFEGPDEGAVQEFMKSVLSLSDNVATETLVALKREDAIKLLD